MTPRLCLLAAAVAALGSVPTGAAELAPPPSPKSEPFDVLYYSEARPVVMRLWITTDGAPLNHAWDRFADALFAKLDADASGSLDEKESANIRQTLVLLTGRFVQPGGDAARAPLTRDGLAAYLRSNDFGPLRLPPIANNRQNNRGGFRRGGAPTPEMLDQALLDFLDTNKDGKLSPAELAASVTVLGKLDADENELIGMDELLGRPVNSPFFVEEFDDRRGGVGPPGVDLQAFGRKPDPNLAKRLLGRYGPKMRPTDPNAPRQPQPVPGGRGAPAGQVESTARRLTPKDVKLSADQFAALDQDGDGELDAEELARFGQSAVPEVEIALWLGRLPAGRARAEVVSAGGPLKTVPGDLGEDVALEVPGVRLELIPTRSSADAGRAAWRANYLDRFRAFDRDNNGYLDASESGNDFVFRDLFAFFDADKDGKVFEKELVAALDGVGDLATAAARGLTAVDVTESGRGLFGLIDTDGDGRLSVRELRVAPKLVARFDADKDRLLAPGELPRRFLATLSRGLASAGFARPVGFAPGGMTGTPRPPVGPMWFQKMDRNRDGDVSRREFLGTDAEFRKLDADGDGLISPQEAAAAVTD